MFGNKKQQEAIEALDARLQALEQKLDAIRHAIDSDPDARLRALLDAASDDVRRAVETALEDARRVASVRAEVEAVPELDARLGGADLGPPRQLHIGVTYQAEATGFVSAWFYSGTPSAVRLLQGPTDPPGNLVGHYSASDGGCGGMVVRKGDYWQVDAGGDVKCAFTPFL